MPRIGFGWRPRGQANQSAVVTPGQNQKHYLAGALHAGSGRWVWVEHFDKNTTLFVKLLDELKCCYRWARRIVLVLDSYRIHKSETVARWLAENPNSGCASSSSTTLGSIKSSGCARPCTTPWRATINARSSRSCATTSLDS